MATPRDGQPVGSSGPGKDCLFLLKCRGLAGCPVWRGQLPLRRHSTLCVPQAGGRLLRLEGWGALTGQLGPHGGEGAGPGASSEDQEQSRSLWKAFPPKV